MGVFMRITLTILVLFFTLFSSACTFGSGIDMPSDFDWSYAPHFRWTSEGANAELVCMEEEFHERRDIIFERTEQARYFWERDEEFEIPYTFTPIDEHEFRRRNELASEIILLTQIYNNPSFTGDPDRAVLDWVELGIRFAREDGMTRCLEEFNVRRANFNPPADMPYVTMALPASGWFWDFFLIGVSHTPTRAHVEFILDFFGVTGESVYIIVAPVEGGITHG